MRSNSQQLAIAAVMIAIFSDPSMARPPHSLPARHHTPEEQLREPVNDTIGLSTFVDSLQADVDKGSLRFFFDHVDKGFSGHTLVCCGGGEDLILRTDSAYARSMARVLSWHLVKRKLLLSNPVEDDPVTIARICNELDYPYFDGKKPKNPDTYSVYVEDLGHPLLDSIRGKTIGKVGAHWVKPLKQIGGYKLYKFKGKIGVEWMKVQTPDGRIGWVDSKDLRDASGPGASIGLEHQRRGWWIKDLSRWDDVPDEDP